MDDAFMIRLEMCIFARDRGVSIHPTLHIDTADLGEETEEKFAERAAAIVHLAFDQARQQVLAVGDHHWKGPRNNDV